MIFGYWSFISHPYHKQLKELKRDMGETLNRYEDILTHLEALYSVKPEKYKAQLKEMKENFDILNNRRSTVREKSLEAVKAIEEERNKKEARSTREDRTITRSQGGGGGGDKQLKQPVGPQPGKLSQEFTPLQAENWQADMRIYVKTCSNLQSLSIEDQKTLMKRFVFTALWPLVELGRGDEMGTMIKKVLEAYHRQNPTFIRKVQFLDMMIVKGESYISWANRINQQAE